MQEEERIEDFWLCGIRGIGAASIRALLQEAGNPQAVFRLSDERVKRLLGEKRAERFWAGSGEKQRKTAEERYLRMREKGIFFLPCWDKRYPARLTRVIDAPVCLYGKGRLPGQEKKAVAIVGARECSGYGSEAAKYFAAGLAEKGAVIISGMARGVDSIAQRAALDAGGDSVGVLGCGVDICYPQESRSLYERLAQEGCLLSEYPPGTQPRSALFPPRNRIISGLSDLVLVTEARERSGTLITVDMALEQGREVFAVPGRISDSLSRGCNRLIQNGAGMAVSVQQIWEELAGMHVFADGAGAETNVAEQTSAGTEANRGEGMKAGETGGIQRAEKDCSRPLERRILSVLDSDPVSLDELLNRLDAGNGRSTSVAELAEELMLLWMEGRVERRAGLYYNKIMI